jgi:hypothetical protein
MYQAVEGKGDRDMPRYQLAHAYYADPPGPGRLKAGTWIATDPASVQPNDVYWPGVDPSKLPLVPTSATRTGVESIG